MNKRDAKKKAETETFMVGDLREMIAAARFAGGVSRVNPQFSMAQVCDIYAGALEGRDDSDVLPSRSTPTRDMLKLQNILRDCAP